MILKSQIAKNIIFTAFTFLCFQKLSSQSTNHFGVFPTIDHSGTINKKLDYSFYYFGAFNLLNPKINGQAQTANFFLFYSEQALHYNFNSKFSVTGSYVFQRADPTEKFYTNENRFYLQTTYKSTVGRSELKNRLRYDGRFIEDKVSNKWPYTSRVRYLFGAKIPLQKEKNNLHFLFYNEFFFNTFKSAAVTYAENWAFAGMIFKTSSCGTWEIGPLYIFWVNNPKYDLTNLLYLQLTWNTHLDFSKKKSD